MDNKGLLAIIAVILIGIFGLLLFQATEKSPEEKVADSISNTVDQIGDSVSNSVE
jgi:hypothetical protein